MFVAECKNCKKVSEDVSCNFCPNCGRQDIIYRIELPGPEISISFPLLQDENVFKDLPGVSASYSHIIAPDSKNNSFVLLKYQKSGKAVNLIRENLRISLAEELLFSSDPLFDGLYFNFINSNELYRIKGQDKVDESIIKDEFHAQKTVQQKLKPVLFRSIQERHLIFKFDRHLNILNITSDKFPTPPIKIPLYNDDKLFLQVSEWEKRIYCISETGEIFYLQYPDYIKKENYTPESLPVTSQKKQVKFVKYIDNKLKLFCQDELSSGDVMVIIEPQKAGINEIKLPVGNVEEEDVIFCEGYSLLKDRAGTSKFYRIFDSGGISPIDLDNINPKISRVINEKIISVNNSNGNLYVHDSSNFKQLKVVPLNQTASSSSDYVSWMEVFDELCVLFSAHKISVISI